MSSAKCKLRWLKTQHHPAYFRDPRALLLAQLSFIRKFVAHFTSPALHNHENIGVLCVHISRAGGKEVLCGSEAIEESVPYIVSSLSRQAGQTTWDDSLAAGFTHRKLSSLFVIALFFPGLRAGELIEPRRILIRMMSAI